MKTIAAQKKKPEAEELPPDVEVGDEVYYRHPRHGPTHGKVHARGKDGCVMDCAADGKRYRVRWEHMLGHRIKVQPAFKVVDEGQDGFIVADHGGARRRYIHDADNGSSFTKAMPVALVFGDVFKAIKNGPGLSLQDVTDRRGQRTKRWKKTTPDQKGEPRAPARQEPEKPRPDVHVGQDVSFKMGEVSGSGKVIAHGDDGVTVRDASGRDHGVHWHELEAGETKGAAKPGSGVENQHEKKAPSFPARRDGEGDKQYLKRVKAALPVPESLPEEHARYFKMQDATVIPIDKLQSSKTDEENARGGASAPKIMHAAYHGHVSRRAPIKVTANADGTYRVVDGNGTLTGAKAHGWKALPATVCQPFETREALYAASGVALESLKGWLSGKDGVCSKLGIQTSKKGPEALTEGEWDKPGGVLFIAPLKGDDRAKEKVETKYDGDWSRLMDTVRCTIAVDSLANVADVMERLKASGMQLVKPAENRFDKPTPSGYSDIQLAVRMPNGVVAEVQVNIKAMVRAKIEGHKLYEIERSFIVTHKDKPVDQWPAADVAKYRKVVDTQKRLYLDAKHKVFGNKPIANDGEGD